MIPKVVQVVAGIDFTVYVYFLDGSIRLLDAKPLLEKGGVFAPLQNEETFRNCLTVLFQHLQVCISRFPLQHRKPCANHIIRIGLLPLFYSRIVL